MNEPVRNIPLELQRVARVLAAESAAIEALTAHPPLRETAGRIGAIRDRARRRIALSGAIRHAQRVLDDPSAVTRTWAEVRRATWDLAMCGRPLLRAARRFASGLASAEDVVQEAALGLYEAARRYEATRQVRFTTYARWWVRAQLTGARERSWRAVRVPEHALREQRRVQRAAAELALRGRPSGARALAAAVGLEVERVERLLALLSPASLEVPTLELGEDEDLFEVVARRRALATLEAALLTRLDPREREIVSLRYGLDGTSPPSYREIGERLRLSGERVRQLHHDALSVLRGTLR